MENTSKDILVVGSIALDSLETPFGKVTDALGGSAVHFAAAASFFAPIGVVGVIGQDFPETHLKFLKDKGVDLQGVQRVKGSSFRWQGRYEFDMNVAHTLKTELGVFADFKPQIPAPLSRPSILFLGNIAPALQLEVVQAISRPRIIACDTMNYWIEGRRAELLKTLQEVDILLINEGEARALSKEVNIRKAATKILQMGPERVVIKQGEYGALMFSDTMVFSAPGLPIETVIDPTGAGDSFAGGFLGALAKMGNHAYTEEDYRQAVIFGSVMASFNVEKFSCDRLRELGWNEIQERFKLFQNLSRFRDSHWV